MRNMHTRRSFTYGFIGVLLICLVIFGTGGTAVAAAKRTPTLVASGRAEVKAVPDLAVFGVGVETRAETGEQAREMNARLVHDIREALLAAGVDDKAIQTRGLRVHPEWRHNPQDGTRTFVGYVVSHTLEVTVTDLDELGTLLDIALQKGATNISGPTFGLRNQAELEAKALTEAVRRAKAKAEVMARAAGVFLQRIIHIDEHVTLPFDGGVEFAAFRAAAAADAMPMTVSPGEISVTATVTMTFEI